MNKKNYLLLISLIFISLVILSIITGTFYIINNKKNIKIDENFILDFKLEKAQILKVLPGKDFDNDYICVGKVTDSVEAEGVYIMSEETKEIIDKWNEEIRNIKVLLPIHIDIETKNDILEIKKMDKKSDFFELNYIDNFAMEIAELREVTNQDFFDNLEQIEVYYKFLKQYRIITFP